MLITMTIVLLIYYRVNMGNKRQFSLIFLCFESISFFFLKCCSWYLGDQKGFIALRRKSNCKNQRENKETSDINPLLHSDLISEILKLTTIFA